MAELCTFFCLVPQRGDRIRPAETQEVRLMQQLYNGHCLGLERQALILHRSHGERGPFKPAQVPCCHSPCEILALPLLLKCTPQLKKYILHWAIAPKAKLWFYAPIKARLETPQGENQLISDFGWSTSSWSTLASARIQSQRNKTALNSILLSSWVLKRSPSFEITDFLWVLYYCAAMGVTSPMECFIVLRRCLQGSAGCCGVDSMSQETIWSLLAVQNGGRVLQIMKYGPAASAVFKVTVRHY